MAETADDSSIHPCESCGGPIDVLAVTPLTVVRCPACDHPNLVNTQFHHFKLLEIVGSGGMGSVYRALDQSLNRTVALKLLRTEHMLDQTIVAQFEKEAAITAAINHPNVVKIFSTGTDRGTVYIVMELVDKGSLDDMMTSLGRVAEAQVLDVGIQIARGLQAAWRNGLLHRDVKPGNILFNDAHTAKMVDFGLAALADESGQIGGEIWGTPYYVAPEKLESPPQEDFRSDIYSLGSALFHAMAGRPPYEAEDASIVVLKVLKSQPVSLHSFAPDVSSATNFVINRMLKKNPDERYQSYEELIEHLQYARAELARNHTARPLPPAPAKGSPWVSLTVGALVVAAGVYFYQQYQRNHTATEKPPVAPQPAMMADAVERSAEARRLLLTGDPASAARAVDAFRALEIETVPQPLRSWNTLQRLLAQMLAGPATSASAAAASSPIPADIPGGVPAEFFNETTARATAEMPPSAALAEKLDPATHQGFALLVAGVRNWTAGNFADAVKLFERFRSATPAEPHAWIAEYQPLAASFVADHEAFTRATTAAQAAADLPAGKKNALAVVREAATQVRHQGPLKEQLSTLETQLAADVAAYEAEHAKQMAALNDADAATLLKAQPEIDDFCRQFRFADAMNLAQDIHLRGEENAPRLALLERRLVWLAAFKRDFFEDLREAKYQGVVQSVTGPNLGAGLWVPKDTSIKVMGGSVDFETPWGNVHPDAIIAAVHAALRRPLTAEQAADRKWGLGLYLLAYRLEAKARPYLTEASAVREDYREALPQLGLASP